MSSTDLHHGASVPWLLTGPGLVLFSVIVIFPISLTAILSVSVYDTITLIGDGYTIFNYIDVIEDRYYLWIFWRTLKLALIATLICIIIGLPEAYILSRMRDPWRSIFLLVILGPLLVSVVVRAFGWTMLLGRNGVVNKVLDLFGIGPIQILYSEIAVLLGLIHVALPLMVIPIWTSLQKVDLSTEAAAWTLGASRFTAIRRIILPQITPGILSGSLIVFGFTASSFVIPGLLGGRRIKMSATVVYDEYLHTLNWPRGAAIAFILLSINFAVVLVGSWLIERRFRRTMG